MAKNSKQHVIEKLLQNLELLSPPHLFCIYLINQKQRLLHFISKLDTKIIGIYFKIKNKDYSNLFQN